MNAETYKEYLDKVRSVQGYKPISIALLDLKEGQKVLDVGCGTGEDAQELAQLVEPTGLVVGIDIAPEMIQAAQKNAKGSALPIQYEVEDAHELSFSDNAFDVVRTDRSLQHVENPFKVMTEIHRITKPYGIVVVSEPDWGTLVIDSADYDLTTKIIGRGWEATVCHHWMGRHLFALFNKCGLTDVEVMAITDTLTDFPKAREVFRLDDLIQKAGVDSAEGEAWLKSLEEADQEGLFFSSMTMYLVSGRK